MASEATSRFLVGKLLHHDIPDWRTTLAAASHLVPEASTDRIGRWLNGLFGSGPALDPGPGEDVTGTEQATAR